MTTKTNPVRRLPGHKLTVEWSGEYGENSSSTGTCPCGWTESGSNREVVRDEYRWHLQRVAERSAPPTLVQGAVYDVTYSQVIGHPEWTLTRRFRFVGIGDGESLWEPEETFVGSKLIRLGVEQVCSLVAVSS